MAIVDSHQESIISGQFRIFLEGVSRAKDTFRNPEVCWGINTNNCSGIKSKQVFFMEMDLLAPVKVAPNTPPIAIAKASISLLPVMYLSLIVLLSFLGTYFLVWYCLKMLHQNEGQLRNYLGNEVLKVLATGEIEDTKYLPNEIRFMAETLLKKINQLQKSNVDRVKNEALGKMAAQVAHDIRSPIVALENVLGDSSSLPENNRILVRMALNRIKDIANGLIEKFNNNDDNSLMDPKLVSTVLLSSAVESIASEKRMQLKLKLGIEIEAKIDSESYGLFANVNLAQLKRILSNLCNNAIEAIDKDRGQVVISLSSTEEKVLIQIQDSGKGMDSELLRIILSEGGSHNKSNGMGLGLKHTKEMLAYWHGSLEIDSKPNEGTKVTVILPRARPLSWFVSKICIEPNSFIVILDDDFAIHEVFRSRLNDLKIQQHNIQVIHLTTAAEFQKVIHTLEDKKVLYLCDYELKGQEFTGIELIERNSIIHRSILITSRFDERPVFEKANELNLRRIPKGLAHIVPIEVQNNSLNSNYDVIVNDDHHVH